MYVKKSVTRATGRKLTSCKWSWHFCLLLVYLTRVWRMACYVISQLSEDHRSLERRTDKAKPAQRAAAAAPLAVARLVNDSDLNRESIRNQMIFDWIMNRIELRFS